MAIELTSIVPKHERRLRLVFSNTLGAGAFGTGPAPAFYVVENQDGLGPSPDISAAIIVAGAVSNVELALSADLAEGALYRVTAIGVPALDASTSTSASDQMFRFGTPTTQKNVEPKASDYELLLYGRDLVHNGSDYLEGVDGDLATTEGRANAQGAVTRRLLGGPLAWAPDYSPRARQYVDAPLPTIGTLRTRLERQALRDDRVRSVSAQLVLDGDNPTDSFFQVTPILRGGGPAVPIDVHVFVP
jgi:hypothetical protein